ncbi:MAG: FTR1 family protein [Brevefilum sp.]|nr:FTR1 family protein [Brevefilum sp.]
MDTIIQGVIMAFREGLEAFLVIMILLKFLEKTENETYKKYLWYGLVIGILLSLLFGALLGRVSSLIGGMDTTAKLWESVASFIAVIFIITFIIWMINHGVKMKQHIEGQAALRLSKQGIFFLALFMVLREGVEIALFQFAGRYSLVSIVTGLVLAIILVVLIYFSLVKVKLQTIFNITLAYLILQAGFLLGYSIHEGLTAAKELGMLAVGSPILLKAFDLSETILSHSDGMLGLPLYVTIGWYSKPEWIQFLLQYGLTGFLFLYWYGKNKKRSQSV